MVIETTHARITWKELESYCMYHCENVILFIQDGKMKGKPYPCCQIKSVSAPRCCRLQFPVWAKLQKVYYNPPLTSKQLTESYYSKFGLCPDRELWKCPACGHIQNAEKPACENCGKARP